MPFIIHKRQSGADLQSLSSGFMAGMQLRQQQNAAKSEAEERSAKIEQYRAMTSKYEAEARKLDNETLIKEEDMRLRGAFRRTQPSSGGMASGKSPAPQVSGLGPLGIPLKTESQKPRRSDSYLSEAAKETRTSIEQQGYLRGVDQRPEVQAALQDTPRLARAKGLLKSLNAPTAADKAEFKAAEEAWAANLDSVLRQANRTKRDEIAAETINFLRLGNSEEGRGFNEDAFAVWEEKLEAAIEIGDFTASGRQLQRIQDDFAEVLTAKDRISSLLDDYNGLTKDQHKHAQVSLNDKYANEPTLYRKIVSELQNGSLTAEQLADPKEAKKAVESYLRNYSDYFIAANPNVEITANHQVEADAEKLEGELKATLSFSEGIHNNTPMSQAIVAQLQYAHRSYLQKMAGTMSDKELATTAVSWAMAEVNDALMAKGLFGIRPQALIGHLKNSATQYDSSVVADENWLFESREEPFAEELSQADQLRQETEAARQAETDETSGLPSVEGARQENAREQEAYSDAEEGQQSYIQRVAEAKTFEETMAAAKEKAVFNTNNPRSSKEVMSTRGEPTRRVIPLGLTREEAEAHVETRANRLMEDFDGEAKRKQVFGLTTLSGNTKQIRRSIAALKSLKPEARKMWLLKAEEQLIDNPVDETSHLGKPKGKTRLGEGEYMLQDPHLDVLRGISSATGYDRIDIHDIAIVANRLRKKANGTLSESDFEQSAVEPATESSPSTSFPSPHPEVENEDGSKSHVKLATYEVDGKHRVLPTMVEGKDLSDDEVIASAQKYGLNNYPSFDTAEEADAWAKANHGKIVGAKDSSSAPAPDSAAEPAVDERDGQYQDEQGQWLPIGMDQKALDRFIRIKDMDPARKTLPIDARELANMKGKFKGSNDKEGFAKAIKDRWGLDISTANAQTAESGANQLWSNLYLLHMGEEQIVEATHPRS